MNENFMNYEILCDKIIKIDETIRFAGVYADKGEMVCVKVRDNMKSMLTPEQVKMSMHYAKLRNETREHLVTNIGKPEFSVTKYEKVIRFTIPLEKNSLLLISTDTNANYANIADEILKIIKKIKIRIMETSKWYHLTKHCTVKTYRKFLIVQLTKLNILN